MMYTNKSLQKLVHAGIFNKNQLLHYPSHAKQLLKKDGIFYCLINHLLAPEDVIHLSPIDIQKLEHIPALMFLTPLTMNLKYFLAFNLNQLLNLDSYGIQKLIEHQILSIDKASQLKPLQKNILASYGVNRLLLTHQLSLTKAMHLTLTQAMILKSSWVLKHINEHKLSISQALKLDLDTIAKHIAH